MRKQKTKPVTGVTFTKTDQNPVRAEQRDKVEFVVGGHSGEGIYSTRGCKLEVEAALVQTYAADNYQLCLKLGAEWYPVMTVHADDPQVMALREEGRLIESGPSPSELEMQRKKAEDEAHRLRMEEWKKQERKAVHEERRRKAEEKEVRARAERRARVA